MAMNESLTDSWYIAQPCQRLSLISAQVLAHFSPPLARSPRDNRSDISFSQ